MEPVMIAKLLLATSLLVAAGALESAVARPKLFDQSQSSPTVYGQWGINKSDAITGVPLEHPQSSIFSHQYGPSNSWVYR
jgi:hypothetical protein